MPRYGNILRLFLVVSVCCHGIFLSSHAAGCTAEYGEGAGRFSLATGSPGELGLLERAAESFNKKHGTTLCWKKAGSGEALNLLKEKKVDMIIVHAPALEKKAIQEGWAVKRTLIGSNEFYIIGPRDDPAGISGAENVADACTRIARSQTRFLSRGDNSGTHKKETAIWARAEIRPTGDWYVVTRTFMKATLKQADEERAYSMTDSSTWAALKKEMRNLAILFRGDPFLINTYHALCQPEGATPGQTEASMFINFLGSTEGQEIIRSYGVDRYGEGLYNDAAYAEQYDH